MPDWGFALAATILTISGSAMAAPRELTLGPQQASVGFRAYALGVMPIDGTFDRFAGTLRYDNGSPSGCAVDLTVTTASLDMQDPSIRADVLSETFLDAATFPTLAFHGTCSGGSIIGTLSMHGQSRPVSFAAEIEDGRLTATTAVRRSAWGMAARPLLAGPTLRISVSVALPPDAGGLLAGAGR